MNQFKSFLRKEYLHIFRDWRTLLILIVMPLVLTLLFGYVLTTEVRNSRIAVADCMQSPQSRAVISAIEGSAYFSVVDVSHNPRFSDDIIRRGQADAMLIMHPEMGVQILADGSEPNQAQQRAAYIQSIIMQTLKAGSEMPAGASVRMLFNPQQKSEYNFVPAIIGMIIMLICVMMTSVSIVREKEMGTMEILLASPLHPLVIIIAKLVPYFTVSSANIICILLLSRWAFHLPIGEVGCGWTAVLSFMLVSVVYIFVALALGLLISCVVNSQKVALLLSILLIVPTLYLSGMVFPLDSVPAPVKAVSCVVPARWYMDAARRLLIQGVEFAHITKGLAVLCVQAAALVVLSLKLFKIRLS